MNVFCRLAVFTFAYMASVMALPDGCPVCTVGVEAPQSLHLFNPITGPISTRQFQVTIDGAVVTESPNILRIAPETDLPLVVSSTTGAEFRGILVVLNKEGVNLSNRLVPASSSFKAQQNCPDENRSGITHVDNGLKSSAAATIRMPPGLTAYLDVNIVLLNRYPGGSVFYYSRFEVTTVVPGAPVALPVTAPVPLPLPVTPPIPVPMAPVPVPMAPLPMPIAPVPVPMAPIPTPTAPVPVPIAPIPVPLPVTAPVPLPLPVSPPVPSPMAPIPVPLPVTAPFPVLAPVPLPEALPVPAPVANPAPQPVAPPVPTPVANPTSPVTAPQSEAPMSPPTAAPMQRRCGLLGLSVFCLNGCGIFGRIFRFCTYS